MVVRAALIVDLTPESLAVVGGVPLVVRAARTLRAAGFSEINVVARAQTPEVARLLAARGVDATLWNPRAAEPDALRDAVEPVLVISGDVLFETEVLTPLLVDAEPGRLRVGCHREGVPVAVCPRTDLARLVAALPVGREALRRALDRLGSPGPPVPLGEGLFLAARLDRPPAVLTEALLEHLATSSAGRDGYLAVLFDRHLSRAITRRLLPWPVTPNQVTVISIVVGLAGALGLATVSYAGRLVGVLALFASSVLDGVDGELARARLEQSRFGARLDLAGDYTIHVATFLALGIGLARQGLPAAGLWAAGTLAVGVAAAMAVVHALVIQPGLSGHRGPGRHATSVETVVEKIASRDYTYLLLVAALAGHLDWFLYPAAAGAWVFVAGLLAYWMNGDLDAPPARSPVEDGDRLLRHRPTD